jgi:hypothetical protein
LGGWGDRANIGAACGGDREPTPCSGMGYLGRAKSGGYDLEKTQVSDTRLIELLVLLTIAYSTTSLQSRIIKKIGI